jgi:uncharacterized protein (DUF697 family)
MTRKRLPKALRPASSDLVLTVVGAVADDKGAAALPATTAPLPVPQREGLEPQWDTPPALPANDALGARSANFQRLAAKRLVLANRIVETHGTLAALSGMAPLPAINAIGVAAVILRMLGQLSELYQVRFERNQTRMLVIGILGGAPTGLGAAAVSTIGLVAPAPAFIGLAVSTLTAAAVTRAIGEVFIESFESQAPLN